MTEAEAELQDLSRRATGCLPTIVKVNAWGGMSHVHDFLLSDGSVKTMYDHEADKYRALCALKEGK